MPNWIDNTITVRIENKEKLKKLVNDKGLFETLIPMPEDILRGSMTPKEMEENPKNWYTWSIDNWGCKWKDKPVRFITKEKSFSYNFETPWNPADDKITQRLIEELGEFTYSFRDELPDCDGFEYYFNKNNPEGLLIKSWVQELFSSEHEDKSISETVTLNIFDEEIHRERSSELIDHNEEIDYYSDNTKEIIDDVLKKINDERLNNE